jgi:serine/threonine protein kinase
MLNGGLNVSGPGTTQHDDVELGGADTLVGDDSCTTGSHRPVKLDRGTTLGRYVLLDRVGAGGMGVVYAAYDPELDRRIALKVLKSDAYGDVMASAGPSRLLREAQAMAKLAHTNVVTVHDVGTLGREVFIAMEFIDGVSLRAWLRDRPRTLEHILEAFAHAGRGLAAAHAEGLVHRDFKPDNVLVAPNGRVVVTDFGLARRKNPEDATTQASHPGASATARVIKALEDAIRTAGAAGTPAYMAPEQHTGGEITEATDQFSFCVALHEALYGQHPFRGSDPVSLSTSVVDNVRRPLPSEVHRVPRRIRRALERGMSNDPDRRWPSMRALLAQLGPGPTVARRKWLALGLGGFGLASAVVMWISEAPTNPDAEVVTRDARALAGDVEALQSSYPAPSPGQLARVEEASTLRAKAEALQSAGKLRDALVIAADALRKAEASEYLPSIARARHTLSVAYSSLGNHEIAESLALTALVEARGAADLELEALVWLQWLRVVGHDPRRRDEARRWVPVARAAIARVGDPVGHTSALDALERSLEPALVEDEGAKPRP